MNSIMGPCFLEKRCSFVGFLRMFLFLMVYKVVDGWLVEDVAHGVEDWRSDSKNPGSNPTGSRTFPLPCSKSFQKF